MQREILFRGKTLDDKWLIGHFITRGPYSFIQNNMGGNDAIVQNTLGQYTGYKDKDDKLIFEGDILKSPDDDYEYCIVEWNAKYAAFVIYGYFHEMYFNEGGGEEFSTDLSSEEHTMVFGQDDDFVIIGNVHDNPELLNRAS